MRPKGKLLALFAMFAAVGLITATGAFTTVEAQRTADVQTAGDASALLALEAGGSELIQQETDGEVRITLDSDAQGVNTNATTTVNGTQFLNVTNNGQNTVELNISASGDNGSSVYFVVDNSEYIAGNVTFDNTGNDMSDYITSDLIDEGDKYAVGGSQSDTVVQLNSGDKVSIGLIVDTEGVEANQQIFQNGEVTITAESIDGQSSLGSTP